MILSLFNEGMRVRADTPVESSHRSNRNYSKQQQLLWHRSWASARGFPTDDPEPLAQLRIWHSEHPLKSGWQTPSYGFGTRKTTHPQGPKSRGQKKSYGFGTGKTTHPQGAKSGGQNPSYGFGTRKTSHPQGAKSRGQNPTYALKRKRCFGENAHRRTDQKDMFVFMSESPSIMWIGFGVKPIHAIQRTTDCNTGKL